MALYASSSTPVPARVVEEICNLDYFLCRVNMDLVTKGMRFLVLPLVAQQLHQWQSWPGCVKLHANLTVSV